MTTAEIKNQIDRTLTTNIEKIDEEVALLISKKEKFTLNHAAIMSRLPAIETAINKIGLRIDGFTCTNLCDVVSITATPSEGSKFKFISFKGYDSSSRGRNDKQLVEKATKLKNKLFEIVGLGVSVNKYSLEDNATSDISRERGVENRVMIEFRLK